MSSSIWNPEMSSANESVIAKSDLITKFLVLNGGSSSSKNLTRSADKLLVLSLIVPAAHTSPTGDRALGRSN